MTAVVESTEKKGAPREIVLKLDLWAWTDEGELKALAQLCDELRHRQVGAGGTSYDLRSYEVIRHGR